jgi:hypothetical protein
MSISMLDYFLNFLFLSLTSFIVFNGGSLADKRITSMDQIQEGLFVKLVDRDSAGKFTHVGEVIKVFVDTKKPKPIPKSHAGYNRNELPVSNSFFEMLTMEGIMSFQMGNPEDNELYITTTKPAGWAKFKKSPEQFKKEKNTTPVVKTKKELVMELVKKNPRKKEKALLTLAKKEIGGVEKQLLNYIKLALSKQ